LQGGGGFGYSGHKAQNAGAADFLEVEADGLGAGLGFRVAATRLDEAAHQITDGTFSAQLVTLGCADQLVGDKVAIVTQRADADREQIALAGAGQQFHHSFLTVEHVLFVARLRAIRHRQLIAFAPLPRLKRLHRVIGTG
jgi:hypothetical protein